MMGGFLTGSHAPKAHKLPLAILRASEVRKNLYRMPHRSADVHKTFRTFGTYLCLEASSSSLLSNRVAYKASVSFSCKGAPSTHDISKIIIILWIS